jgi:L-threonylcarbamoyladenylate synthase
MVSAPTSILPGTSASIGQAAAALRSGRLVAMPTETVYGLAGNARDARAVARIFAAKGRPSFNPLIVHVTSLAEAEALGAFDAAAQRLARRFWPGPLTLVVRARAGNGIADLATAGLGTIALRVPAHPTARALIAASGLPLAAPSANKSGRLSPTCAADVAADFGPEIACVLDGGAAQHGLESTVIDATTDDLVLLRPGAVTAAEIEAATGKPLTRSEHAPDRPSSPGCCRTTRRAPACASTPAMSGPAKRCSRSGPINSPLRGLWSISASAAISSRPPRGCSRPCASSTRRWQARMRRSPSCRSPSTGLARPSTTACAAPPRRVEACTGSRALCCRMRAEATVRRRAQPWSSFRSCGIGAAL